MKLNDVYPDWMLYSGVVGNGGVFTHLLLSSPSPPWGIDGNFAHALDLEYHGNVSGGKTTSPMLDAICHSGLTLQEIHIRISDVIISMCYTNWTKQFETLSFEYDPISNYDMIETMADSDTQQYGKQTTRTDNLTHAKTGTEQQTPDMTGENTRNVYGFNADSEGEGSPSDRNTTRTTGTDTVTYDTTDRDTGTQTQNDSGSDVHTRNYRLTRSGNIGVTTSQQMIQSERDLWQWNFFRNTVFPDLDKILTSPLYETGKRWIVPATDFPPLADDIRY